MIQEQAQQIIPLCLNYLMRPAHSGGGGGYAFGVSAFSTKSVTIFRYRGVSTR